MHVAISPDCSEIHARFHFRRDVSMHSMMSRAEHDWEIAVPRDRLSFSSICCICLVNSASAVIHCGHPACLECLHTGYVGRCMLCRAFATPNQCFLLPASLAIVPEPEESVVDNSLIVLETNAAGFRVDREEVGQRLMRHLRQICSDPRASSMEQLLEERRRLFHQNMSPNAQSHCDFGHLNLARFNPVEITVNSARTLNSIQLRVGQQVHHQLNIRAHSDIVSTSTGQMNVFERHMSTVTQSYQFNPIARYTMQRNAMLAYTNYFRYIDTTGPRAVLDVEEVSLEDDLDDLFNYDLAAVELELFERSRRQLSRSEEDLVVDLDSDSSNEALVFESRDPRRRVETAGPSAQQETVAGSSAHQEAVAAPSAHQEVVAGPSAHQEMVAEIVLTRKWLVDPVLTRKLYLDPETCYTMKHRLADPTICELLARRNHAYEMQAGGEESVDAINIDLPSSGRNIIDGDSVIDLPSEEILIRRRNLSYKLN
ncbi:uncharacterized protein LOC135937606 [Cloeon dipterum]|uniref:uncharacterized protein LOC135937606 n=1 Tax=Cloeon dipterum TaxID=197152 RepID=UPI00322095BA